MQADEAPESQQRFTVPQISQDELFAFHHSHFSNEAVANFGQNFMKPPVLDDSHVGRDYDEWEEEEDDLGYYEDGVKRTLTDEQIEIFRHSELRELRREQEKKAEAETSISPDAPANNSATQTPSQIQESGLPSGFGNNKKKKKSKNPRQEPKPDLRKRTWDVVEPGLDYLDYD